jgi:hypothetical protein
MTVRRPSPPLNYLHAASKPSLESYELSRLNHAANLRREMRRSSTNGSKKPRKRCWPDGYWKNALCSLPKTPAASPRSRGFRSMISQCRNRVFAPRAR